MACGPSERAEKEKVSAGVERIRALPSSQPVEQKKAAEDLLALDIETPRARHARDACGAAYKTKAEYGVLVDEMTGRVAALDGELATEPEKVELTEKMKRVDALLKQLEVELPQCSQAMSNLIGH